MTYATLVGRPWWRQLTARRLGHRLVEGSRSKPGPRQAATTCSERHAAGTPLHDRCSADGSRGLPRDPFGNRVQVVQYDQIQFLKAPGVLAGLGLPLLRKTEAALAELRSNGLA